MTMVVIFTMYALLVNVWPNKYLAYERIASSTLGVRPA